MLPGFPQEFPGSTPERDKALRLQRLLWCSLSFFRYFYHSYIFQDSWRFSFIFLQILLHIINPYKIPALLPLPPVFPVRSRFHRHLRLPVPYRWYSQRSWSHPDYVRSRLQCFPHLRVFAGSRSVYGHPQMKSRRRLIQNVNGLACAAFWQFCCQFDTLCLPPDSSVDGWPSLT